MRIKLFVYDFDGVMTNNKVIVDQRGNESVIVNRGDGLAVSIIKRMNIPQLILSTEANPVVLKRANKLNIICINGVEDKKEKLKEYCIQNDINFKDVLYIGNDINDLDIMKMIGHPYCPADAHESIKVISDYVFKSKGGNGVIRELLDLIIKHKGK